ncbi:hypothetical protein POM88_037141 [Heracleum sosnowskyi]|uniref:Uncharacterized protein n=1 Tax=Heracleum sosnowskyi TaxID=360622 RepID=A0AAD8HPN4_9APIA|nr:hypothetical protein POM88_037141 [Heracleum sosnowskyi]
MGSSKMMPYLNMPIFPISAGSLPDHLITERIMSVTTTTNVLNTIESVVVSSALIALPLFRTSGGVVFCSYVALGLLTLDGTLAGIIGVDLTGKLLDAAKTDNSDAES